MVSKPCVLYTTELHLNSLLSVSILLLCSSNICSVCCVPCLCMLACEVCYFCVQQSQSWWEGSGRKLHLIYICGVLD